MNFFFIALFSYIFFTRGNTFKDGNGFILISVTFTYILGNGLLMIYYIIVEVIIEYFESILPHSHIMVGFTSHDIHPYVRGREYTPRVSNKFLYCRWI